MIKLKNIKTNKVYEGVIINMDLVRVTQEQYFPHFLYFDPEIGRWQKEKLYTHFDGLGTRWVPVDFNGVENAPF